MAWHGLGEAWTDIKYRHLYREISIDEHPNKASFVSCFEMFSMGAWNLGSQALDTFLSLKPFPPFLGLSTPKD